jgi:hypothetical protein
MVKHILKDTHILKLNILGCDRELPEGAPIMTGTFSIDYKPVIILFDSGATHSFISDKCVARVRLDSYQTKGSYIMSTPRGKIGSNELIRCANTVG